MTCSRCWRDWGGRAVFASPLSLSPNLSSKSPPDSPRRQEANRARKEADGGHLSQTKRQWPGAVSPAAAPASDGEPAATVGADIEETEVEEGEVRAAEKEEVVAQPEPEAGSNGANAPKKARKERKQGQVRESRARAPRAA